ncbi:MAG: LCP family protein [Erysipelotrichaceae bacterium]
MLMKKQKKARNQSKGLEFDILLSLILLIIGIAFIYMLYNFNLIPKIWVILGGTLLFLIIAILITLIFVKHPRSAIVVGRRITTIVLVIGLGIGTFYVSTAKNGLASASGLDTTHSKISVLVNEASSIKNVEALKNKKVGYQNGLDEGNAKFAKNKLKKETSKVDFVAMADYTSLANAFINQEIDGLIISDSQIASLIENVSGFPKTRTITTYTRERKNTHLGSNKDLTKEVFTVYVSGLDDPGDPRQNIHSDVNMLLIIDPVANHISMTSFPRDAYVPNAGANYQNDKLTHTGSYGIDATVESMQAFLGIKVDYYAKISFTSIIKIVDILGGITVDVPLDFEEQDENRSFAEGDLIRLKKGVQELDGREALALARHRHSYVDQDISRNKAQQLVLKGIMKKVLSAKGISVIDQLFEALPDVVMTNMNNDQISSFAANELETLKPWTLSSRTLYSGCFDTRITASMAGFPLDVYLFSKDEIREVQEAYDGATHRLAMNTFKFDLQNLHQIAIPGDQDSNMKFVEDAIEPH